MKHKEIFDILRYDKEGKPRENSFLEWCRKVSAMRETDGTATEHAETSEEQERRWYKILAERMLQDDLQPQQRNDETYRIRYNRDGDVVVSSKQRSWIGSMLRKFLGNKNVVFFILQHGLPELFDARVRKEKPSREMLQSILEDGMRWHASLLHSLVEHNERPGLAHARRMSDLEHTAWRRQQREACLVAQQALSRGRRLSMERDSKKRSYDEMSPTEQQLLEDFDVHRLQKQVDKTSMRVEKKAFRGSVLS